MAFARFSPPSRRLALGLAFASLLASSSLLADAAQDRKVHRYDVVGHGRSAGAARAIVKASHAVVRSVVTDFGRYEDFITRFQSAKVVGKVGDKTDVYLKVPILEGTVKIWAVVRFEPPKKDGADEIVVGRMVKGNVKRLDAIWRIRKLDDKSTELRLELTIVPDLPVPNALVLPEVRFAAAKAVGGTRDEAERRAPHS
jgi:ribosome-associated toxin RatA of RatAB toxin-antitoxin module